MTVFLLVSWLTAIVAPSVAANQQPCVSSWTPTFGALPGTVDSVVALTVFDDGLGSGPALYVGGSFARMADVLASRVARWDGTSWSSLGGGVGGGNVNALAGFDDGLGPALYAGGSFLNAGGEPVGRIARWDGSSWSALASGLNGNVLALAVFDDGLGGGPALYAGGSFGSAGSTQTNRIARWDGTAWSSVGSGMDGLVNALVVFDDGTGPALYAAGSFQSAGGTPANHVARWDGVSWSALGAGLGTGSEVGQGLAVFDAGSGDALYACGTFTLAGGAPANRVARWNGASWSALGSGLSHTSSGASVAELAVFDDGGGPELYATGSFNRSGTQVLRGLARWNGAHWSDVGGGGIGLRTLQVFDDGTHGERLYVGGSFTQVGPTKAYSLASWDGARWALPGRGLNDQVTALATFDDGRGDALYASGFFTRADDEDLQRIARWDGGGWESLGSGLDQGAFAATVFDDGTGAALVVGGPFLQAGGQGASRIARWDGSAWSSLGSGLSASVRALAVFDDGLGPALYAGGDFDVAGVVPANGIARWDGASWSALGGGVDDDVYALAVFDDGSGPALYAGGNFGSAGGLEAFGIARWNGSSWAPVRRGLLGPVLALAVHDDGSGSGPALYAGGTFEFTGGGTRVDNVARWDGETWTAVGTGTSGSFGVSVFTLASFDDGSGAGAALYAGGDFWSAGGEEANHIARWDGASWSALGGGLGSFDQRVDILAVFDDGAGPSLFAGGSFRSPTSFFDEFESTDTYLARWKGCHDRTAPVLACPRVELVDPPTSPPGEIVSFAPTATDDFDPAPSVVCEPPSGSFFSPGITLVTCTAKDRAGNESSCVFEVFVRRKVLRR